MGADKGDGAETVMVSAQGAARNEAPEGAPSSGPRAEDGPPKVDAALLREVVRIQPFTRWTGLEVLKAEGGVVETRMQLRKADMTQHHGFLHGGLVGFLADNAAAYAAATVVGDVLTAQYAINFLAPGVGDSFRTRAEVVKAGRRQVTVRSDVYAQSDAGEKLVATATALILPAGAAALEQAPAA
jgi:uncharacterized protein (TIGR00369 family)